MDKERVEKGRGEQAVQGEKRGGVFKNNPRAGNQCRGWFPVDIYALDVGVDSSQ